MKLHVKTNENTIKLGIAGCPVCSILSKDWVDGVLMLVILVTDLDDGPAGPYVVANHETELRAVEA